MEFLNGTFKRPKYGTKPTVVDGIRFPSKAQANRYSELRILEAASEIFLLELEPRFELIVQGKNIGRYTADFKYIEKPNQLFTVEEVKGYASRDYILRKKLFLALYPEFIFKETK